MAEPLDLFGEQPARVAPDGVKGQQERGAFFTPDLLALAICRTLKNELGMEPGRILEPGCGGGAFLRAARAVWPQAKLVGVDLLPACEGPGEVRQGDLFDVREQFDLVLGNPDFSIAERVVRHCAQLAPVVALLLLSSFEESEGRNVVTPPGARAPLWKEHPGWRRQVVAFPRPAFKADGSTDMRMYALFAWKRGYDGPFVNLPALVWR